MPASSSSEGVSYVGVGREAEIRAFLKSTSPSIIAFAPLPRKDRTTC
jgi:hypothetical protein